MYLSVYRKYASNKKGKEIQTRRIYDRTVRTHETLFEIETFEFPIRTYLTFIFDFEYVKKKKKSFCRWWRNK